MRARKIDVLENAIRRRFGRPRRTGMQSIFVQHYNFTRFDFATYIREVEPGEIVVLDENGLHSSSPRPTKPSSNCIFEHVYFSRPHSLIFGRSVNRTRHKMGKRLAKQHHV